MPKRHRPTDWTRFGACHECGVTEGQRCESVAGRWLTRPHQGRRRIDREEAR